MGILNKKAKVYSAPDLLPLGAGMAQFYFTKHFGYYHGKMLKEKNGNYHFSASKRMPYLTLIRALN